MSADFLSCWCGLYGGTMDTTVLQVATAPSGLSKFFRSQRHCLKGFWRCKELREPSDVCLMCQSV